MFAYSTAAEMLALCEREKISVGELALRREIEMSGRSREEIFGKMKALFRTMRESVRRGLEIRNPSPSGLSGGDAAKVLAYAESGDSLLGATLTRLVACSCAVLETNAQFGRIVATPTAVDATAGLGEDSLLLAAAGFTVTMFEQDPVIAALLRDALERAANEPQLAGVVARMTLVEGDSVTGLREMGFSPDVVFLDPMFPERTKSAAVRKKFQLLHHLERPCDNEGELLDAALAARPRKIVIKRPPKGPWLAGAKPSHSLAGKAVRYDVIVPPRG